MTGVELVAEIIDSGARPGLGAVLRAVEEMTAGTPRQHPLGFVYWQHSLSNGSSLRVHLWLDLEHERRDGLTHIHDHVYDLSSLVVFGVIVNKTYTVEPGPSHQQLVSVDQATLDAEFELAGATVTTRVVSSDEWRAGATYSIPRGVFHATTVVGPPALTLVTNSARSGRPRVVTSGSPEPRGTSRETPIVDWRPAFELIMATLERQAGWDDDMVAADHPTYSEDIANQ